MPKRPLTVGDKVFPSLTEAKDYVKSILNHPAYTAEGAILEQGHQDFIKELISLHPNAESKIGVGIERIEIRRNREFPTTRCFFIVRIDGTYTEFSYDKCITQKNVHLSNLKKAFRATVADDVARERKRLLESDEGKRLIAAGELIHADHFGPTFDCLVGKFLEQYSTQWTEVEFEGLNQDNSSIVTFVDADLRQAFQAFHSKHANLRAVTRDDNLRLYKTGVRKVNITPDLFVYVHEEDWGRSFPL